MRLSPNGIRRGKPFNSCPTCSIPSNNWTKFIALRQFIMASSSFEFDEAEASCSWDVVGEVKVIALGFVVPFDAYPQTRC